MCMSQASKNVSLSSVCVLTASFRVTWLPETRVSKSTPLYPHTDIRGSQTVLKRSLRPYMAAFSACRKLVGESEAVKHRQFEYLGIVSAEFASSTCYLLHLIQRVSVLQRCRPIRIVPLSTWYCATAVFRPLSLCDNPSVAAVLF